jgi:hypothetical protein
LHELRAISADGHGDLDAGPGLVPILPMRGEHDRVAQAVGLAQPQAVIETFHRRALADVHIVILHRRDSLSIPAISAKSRDGQRFVAVFLVNPKKPDRRCGEKPVDGHLNIRAHVTRKLSRGRDQPVPRNAGEMPVQRVAGIVELLVADEFGQVARDLVHAVIADQRLHAFHCKPVLAAKHAAEFALAGTYFIGAGNRFTGDPQRMTRSNDALPGGCKQPVGYFAGIGPANCLPVRVYGFGKLERAGYRLAEYRMQKLDDELQRSFIVVVQDHLEVAGLGVNIGHVLVPPD